MNIFDTLFDGTKIPPMSKVRFQVERGGIQAQDIPGVIARSLENQGLLDSIERGKTVAVTCGSREISQIDRILKSLVDLLAARGAKPFIFPAMGSHGGALAAGQLEILEGYGVTPETMGVPVKATMDTVVLGKTASGLEVHFDQNAYQADYVIPVGRIKPHTDFRGRFESGLMKMLAIGCGKQKGANLCHTLGFPRMAQNVEEIARLVLERRRIPFGIAIVEDMFHGTYLLEAIPGEKIPEREPALLEKAKALIPGIPFEKIDVLILDEIGKEISGAGMDPNITGRSGMMGSWKPFIERIAVLDLSEKSHHNGCGIGTADVTTQRFYEKMDYCVSYPNGITSHDPASMRIPPIMPDDRNAVRMALQTCVQNDPAMGYRMVWMKNTLHMDTFYISPALLREAEENPAITIEGEPKAVPFNRSGNVPWLDAPGGSYGFHPPIPNFTP